MDEPAKRRRFQFSLKWLLIVMSLIAMYAMGYSAGYHNGKVTTTKYFVEKESSPSSKNSSPTN